MEEFTSTDGNIVVVFSDYDPHKVLRRKTSFHLEESIVVSDFFPSEKRKEESYFTAYGELKTIWKFDESGRVTFYSEYEAGSIVRTYDRKYDCNSDHYEQISYNDLGEPYLWTKGRLKEGRGKIVERRDLLAPPKRVEMRLRTLSRFEKKLGRKLPRPDMTQLSRGFAEG